MLSIYRKEIAAYFNALTGYLTIGVFLLVSGLLLWVFPDTSIPAHGYASLEPFFQLAPYLFMLLIPAITMRSIAGERTEGTWELLLTRPVTMWSILLGKYLGSLSVVLLAILPTSVYFVAIHQLAMPAGNVDTGAVIGSYVGLFLLGAAFAAIGLLASAVSGNAIVAFLLAIVGCFAWYYAFDALGGIQSLAPHAYALSLFGIQSHYEALSRGVMDSRDVCYFLTIVAVFLWAAHAHLTRTRAPRSRRLAQGAAVIACAVTLNAVSSSFFTRFDFTAERRFTLSPLAVQTAKGLQEDVHVTVLLDGDLPAGFARLKRATADLLNDLKAHSSGRLTFGFANPMDGGTERQRENIEALADRGLTPTNLSVRTATGVMQQLIFPAALLYQGDDELAVNLLQDRAGSPHEVVLNNSVQNLEYAFVSAIRKVASGGRPLVGFTEGHGELAGSQLQDAIQTLLSGYQVGFVDLDSITPEGLRQLNVLVVAKPTKPFTEATKFKIDHFVMNGGNMLWAIDQSDAELDSLRRTGQQIALARQLNLDDMLFTYGIRFNYDLIADMNCAQIPLTAGGAGAQARIELVPWLFHPVFVPTAAHPLVKDLDGIRSEFAGTLDTLAAPHVDKSIILHSSPFSRVRNLPTTLSLGLVEETPDPARFKGEPRAVAAVLAGGFPSVFANRPTPPGIDPAIRTPERGEPAKMVAIADGDVLKGQVNPGDGSAYPLGWDRYTETQYGNKSFLLNAVDYLADDAGVIALRNKEVKLRLLDQVALKEHQVRWQIGTVAVPVALLLAVALGQQYLRQRRYGRIRRRNAS